MGDKNSRLDYSIIIKNIEVIQKYLSLLLVGNIANANGISDLEQLHDAFHLIAMGSHRLRGAFLKLADDWFKGSLSGAFKNLTPQEIRILADVVNDMAGIFEYGYPYEGRLVSLIGLLNTFRSADIERLVQELFSDDANEKAEAQKQIAHLLDEIEIVLGAFYTFLDANHGRVNSVTWFSKKGDPERRDWFAVYAACMVQLRDHIAKIRVAITAIKSRLQNAMDKNNATWLELFKWLLEQLSEKIPEKLIGDFLASDAAKKQGITLEDLQRCTTKNKHLQAYHKNPTNSAGDIKMPEIIDANGNDCVAFYTRFIQALLEKMVPLDEINPRTGLKRKLEVQQGLYAAGRPGSQIVNAKFTNTGFDSDAHRSCQQAGDPDKEDQYNNFNNEGKPTKYYSLTAVVPPDSKSSTTRTLGNLMVTVNNPDTADHFTSVTEVAATLGLVERQEGYIVEGEQTAEQITQLLQYGDIMVKPCDQKLGKSLPVDGKLYVSVNHQEMSNQTGQIREFKGLDQLSSGEKVFGIVSISAEKDECNRKSTVGARKDCANELFMQIQHMAAAYLTSRSAVHYTYYLVELDSLPASYANLEVVKAGFSASIDLAKRPRDNNFAVIQEVWIQIVASGNYTFYLNSDDGSKLSIDGVTKIDNDGLHAVREESATTYLLAGYHKVRVEYFQRGGDRVLQVSYKGPDTQQVRQEVGANVSTINRTGGPFIFRMFGNLLNNEEVETEGVADPTGAGVQNYIPKVIKSALLHAQEHAVH